jgi:hypothetical protein
VAVLPGTGRTLDFADPRVKAAVAMSAPVTRNARRDLDRAFVSIAVPVLHMTGTKDNSPIGETRAAQRRLPFDHSRKADALLITFQGGDHMIFSGRRRGGLRKLRDAGFQEWILLSSVAFWEATLKENRAARAWLWEGQLARGLGERGMLEAKPGAP